MLLGISKFGGLFPRVKDPRLLPENKSQIAINANFEEGGIRPLRRNLYDSAPGKTAALSLFRYYGDSETVFFTWITDVDAVKAPLPWDTYNRVFYTEAGQLRVTDTEHYDDGGTAYPMTYYNPSPPAPAAAIVAAGTPVGPDPTLMETRAYVYTYVNAFGAEGPPSTASNLLDIYDGNTVNLSNMSTGPAAEYEVTLKRIYRLNQTAGGFSQYQFVAEIAVADVAYSDTILDSALSEVLNSTEWDGAPTGIKGLIALPNGVLAGFVDNVLCYSVPFYPHAWPAAYQKTFEKDIVGLGAFGTTVVVTTEGTPYVNVGNDPANTVSERVQGFACMSKEGIVQAGEVVIYPSPEGLVAIGPTGVELITWEIITPEQWYETYAPATIKAFYWQGKYIGFYDRGVSPFNTQAGFIFDLKTKDLIELDFYATAGYYDKVDGTLYLIVDEEIVCFNEEITGNLEVSQAPDPAWSPDEVVVGETSLVEATIVSVISPTAYEITDATGVFIIGEVIRSTEI
jgi:hypothetical protein